MLKYDETNINSIQEYSKNLIGRTFLDIINESDLSANEKANAINKYKSKSFKGGLGVLLEEVFFGYKANSVQDADFSEAGIELKSSPYEIKKDGSLRAGERLSITMVPHDRPIETDFFKSLPWHKIKLILLVYYLRNRDLDSKLDNKIDYSYLLKIPDEDLKIIIEDYKKIVDKVISGKAHEISEGDTIYLGACTKGATAASSMHPQFYGEHIPAKSRNFCLKQSYMSYLLNEYIKPNKVTYESIIESIKDYKDFMTFEENVMRTINSYKGKSDQELCEIFDRPYNNNKSQWIDLSFRMLGIKSNKALEFEKANIVVKAIRIEEDISINENMSFPAFKFKEIVQEEWEDSSIFEYFESTKFLFVVFKKSNGNYKLTGCQFWNMPKIIIENQLRTGWEKVVDTIKNGVELKITYDRNGKANVRNNLLKKSEHDIIHVRPHSTQSYYEFLDGTIIKGPDSQKSYANQLPDGRWMTTQCFWINNDYIIKQIKNDLKR